MKSYFPEEYVLNPEQSAILNSPANIIISGAAGTGKTLLAIALAKKLSKQHKVAVIAFNVVLRKFIGESLKNTEVPVFYDSWDYYAETEFDYLIVDETQDFTHYEIDKIIRRAVKGVYLFGDDFQQLYNEWPRNRTVISLKRIREITGFPVVELNQNMRVSSNNVRFLNELFTDRVFSTSNTNGIDFLPTIESFDREKEQLEYISHQISKFLGGTIAVLLSKNEEVLKFHRFLSKSVVGKKVGYKAGSVNELVLNELESINIMTFHSSKGLEFDHVILPNSGHDDRNAMYVGCSRARYSLIITQRDNILFSGVSKTLYEGDSTKDSIAEIEINYRVNELDIQKCKLTLDLEYATDSKITTLLKSEIWKIDEEINLLAKAKQEIECRRRAGYTP